MAKINISFNGTNYQIDEASLQTAIAALRQYLSTTMNGTGATINFDGESFSVDSTKLATATNTFVTHLGTVSGEGERVVVGGVEFCVDSAKVAGAIGELEAVLGELDSGGGSYNDNVIIFDGNLEGKVVIVHPGEASLKEEYPDAVWRFVKISDNAYTAEQLNNSTITQHRFLDGELEEHITSNEELFVESAGIVADNQGSFIISVADPSQIPSTVPLTSAGLYFIYQNIPNFNGQHLISYIHKIEFSAPAPTQETLEGDGQEFHKFAPSALSFRSTAPLNELQEVQINGVTVDPSNYTLEEGSTIVTLPIEYLKTLDVDNYEITVVSDSKSAKGGFTVVEPELNEHGFYYNQPYTATVAALGGRKVAFFIRDDGTLDTITIGSNTSVCTYTIDGNTVTVVTEYMGTLTATLSSDPTEIFCNTLQTTFKLGDNSIAADDDYIYFYKEDLGGYEVAAIDKTKVVSAEIGAIKTGVNGIVTVGLMTDCFGHTYATTVPKIPNGIKYIGAEAFANCPVLKVVELPNSVMLIDYEAFYSFNGDIIFDGTMLEWENISKDSTWNKSANMESKVICSDGQVSLV